MTSLCGAENLLGRQSEDTVMCVLYTGSTAVAAECVCINHVLLLCGCTVIVLLSARIPAYLFFAAMSQRLTKLWSTV